MTWRFTNTVVIALLASFCMGAQESIAQQPTIGVYITVKYSKKCENPVTSFENEKFCLTAEPVLTQKDLSHISTIKLDLANRAYFSLVFTEDGAKKLKNLSIGFPNTQIVLVVDKEIVGFLTDLETLRSNSLKMAAVDGSTQNVEFVHGKLKSVLPVRN